MKLIANPTVSLWDRVVACSEHATFFHTSTWAHIIVRTFPDYHVATKGYVLDDNTVVIVPIVGTRERNRLFGWYESVFPGGYGGPVAERQLTPSETEQIYRALPDAATAYIHLMGNPFRAIDSPPNYANTPQHTHVLDLTTGYDKLYSEFVSDKKRCIKKAQKSGVTIGMAECEQDFRDYFAVYQDTLRRWGETTLVSYPYDLFEQMYRSQSDAIKLWLARIDGKIVSGKVLFYHNGGALYWHGATLERFFDHQPSTLLMAEIIRDACERGLAYFDFGPSGGLKGVERFKEGFGAQKLHFFSHVWQNNRLYHAYQQLRRWRAERKR